MQHFTYCILMVIVFTGEQALATHDPVVDSLKTLIEVETDDSTKASIYSQLYVARRHQNLKEALTYLEAQEKIVNRISCGCCKASLLLNKTWLHADRGEYKEAEALFLEGLKVAETYCDDQMVFAFHNNLGLLYQNMDRLEDAVSQFNVTLELAYHVGDTFYQMRTLNNLGIVYFKLKEYDKAAEYYRQAMIHTQKIGDRRKEGSIHTNLGNVYSIKEEFDSAIVHYRIAVQFAEEMGDSIVLKKRYSNMGIIHFFQGKYGEAKKYLEKSLNLAISLGDRRQEGIAYENLAEVAATQEQYLLATQQVRQAIEIFEDIDHQHGLRNSYKNLTTYLTQLGDFKGALEAQGKYVELLKEFSGELSSANLAEELAKYDAAKLKYENEIISANLKLEQQANEIKDLQLQRTYLISATALGILIVIGIICLYLFRAFRLKQRLRMAELEQTALRARMNPHFLFNALNSIQNAILNKDKMVAFEYHGKFSQLMRMILVQSGQPTVPLSEELQTLNLYMELEQFRTNDQFQFHLHIDPKIIQTKTFIPTMLLQPYVENAIWHGIMNKKEKGRIDIRIKVENGVLHCEIEDDGVGREAALELRASDHQSYGMEVTENRLQLYNQKLNPSLSVDIEDKYESGNPAGTCVKLFIPSQKIA